MNRREDGNRTPAEHDFNRSDEHFQATSQKGLAEFIRVEIETGMTFVDLAITEARFGTAEQALKVRSLAQTAFDEAFYRMDQAERHGWPIGDLRKQLQVLADRIEALPGAQER